MRFILLLCVILGSLYACNNDLSTIGQNLIYNSNRVEVKTTILTETGTIKLDSFITSSGRTGAPLKEYFVGRYQDEYSGTTEACTYFQVAPVRDPSIKSWLALDSVTFHVGFKKLWGDSLTTKLQTFELRRLQEIPQLNEDNDDYFYNVNSVPLREEILGTMTFVPKPSQMKYAYFKLDTTGFLSDLFDRMKYHDPIFDVSTSGQIRYKKFIDYFKGLCLRPVGETNCLTSINDTLYMRFHYHEQDNKYYEELRLLTADPVYNFYSVRNTPSAQFGLTALTNQEQEVMFSAHEFAILQGMAGYMIRIDLPMPEQTQAYQTVVKAEIELIPEVWNDPIIAYPSTINVFHTDRLNQINGVVYNTGTTPVTGTYVQDRDNIQNNRYIFNITDYYNSISNSSTVDKRRFLLTLPTMSSSFDRMILREEPILRVYYTTYKD